MFDNWTYVEWLILVIDILAVVIVVRFLRNKIKKKLQEVELHQTTKLDNVENILSKLLKNNFGHVNNPWL